MNPQGQLNHTIAPAINDTNTMSVIPAAPPLPSASLFSRAKDVTNSSISHKPFRAKETPYHTYASPTSTSTDESKSCPPSSSTTSAFSSSSGPRSADAPWKATLRAECVARVRAQRQALVQKLRGLDKKTTMEADAANNVSMNAANNIAAPSSSAAAALHSAQASLASSLRSIIDDELARHRSQALSPSNLHSPSPSSPFASTSFSFPASSTSSSSASSRPVPASRSGALQSSSSVIQEAFGGEDENFLSADEYLAIMDQMTEEVNREMEMDIQLEQQMFHASSSSSSTHFAPSLTKSPSPDEQFLLAQQYTREAAEAMEAEQAAFEEFEMYSTPSSIPCPCCHQSSSVTFQNQFATCSCGLRYQCESLQQFKQQLSDAFEVHAVKCQLQPKFISTPARSHHPSHLMMGSSSIPVQAAFPPANPLALACEKCQTWLTLPVEVGAWNSNPNSQQDHEMTD